MKLKKVTQVSDSPLTDQLEVFRSPIGTEVMKKTGANKAPTIADGVKIAKDELPKGSMYAAGGSVAGIEQDDDGKIRVDPKKMALGMILGLAGRRVNIDKLTRKELEEVIDYARLKPGISSKLEEQAGYLAQWMEKRYNVKAAKTLSQLSNQFETLLRNIKS